MRFFAFLTMLALFASSVPVQAAEMMAQEGDLIKGSMSTVYYYATDGKRYVFPTEKTYKSWYGDDYSGVVTISDSELSSIPLGGNVTYRPGVKMVKITTDPRTYAVSKGGILRWVETEAAAIELYGADWNKMIDDIPDPFFVNYRIGSSIAGKDDFNPGGEKAQAMYIWQDKGMEAPQ
ncbi:MAG: hypothetical protein ACOYUZ_01205 [Patescibacteria group bacterium]